MDNGALAPCVPTPSTTIVLIVCMEITDMFYRFLLSHWGRLTRICVSELTIIGSENGSPPGRRQAIIWTHAGLLSVGPLGTNFIELLIEFHTFSFKKMYLKTLPAKWRPSVLGRYESNEIQTFSFKKIIWKCLRNGGNFVAASMC